LLYRGRFHDRDGVCCLFFRHVHHRPFETPSRKKVRGHLAEPIEKVIAKEHVASGLKGLKISGSRSYPGSKDQ
jgi:hypothetical protein